MFSVCTEKEDSDKDNHFSVVWVEGKWFKKMFHVTVSWSRAIQNIC